MAIYKDKKEDGKYGNMLLSRRTAMHHKEQGIKNPKAKRNK
jgi:hypothetical protein